ncbi:MAG TPA: MEDS domain-containing protein, partial [Solirubrobacteraceae bacterium]
EHACCRFAHADDQEQIVGAFVTDALARGHKVLYLCDAEDADTLAGRLASDHHFDDALASGQLELRSARGADTPGGAFDTEQMLATVREEHARALADGYPALSVTGEMSWALEGGPAQSSELAQYEDRLAELMAPDSLVLMCQYDHVRFARGTLSEVAATHPIDVAPELGAINRATGLAAAHVVSDDTLRLAGELDFVSADAVVGVLDAHFHGELRYDLADLRYVDVAGMRALRGRKGQRVSISAASEPVRQLFALMAWDTDDGIDLVSAA